MRLPVLYSFLVPVPADSHSGITHSINQLGGTYTLTHQIATNNSNSSLVPRSGFIAIDQSNRERTCSQNNKNSNSSCPQGRKKKPIKQSITAIRLLVPREGINQSINQIGVVHILPLQIYIKFAQIMKQHKGAVSCLWKFKVKNTGSCFEEFKFLPRRH